MKTSHRLCKVCGLPNQLDLLVCLRCGSPLVDPIITHPVVEPEPVNDPFLEIAGHEEIEEIGEDTSIVLEIDREVVSLPIAESLMIGRKSPEDVPDPSPIDLIDLTPFQGLELGVSRRHIEIRRRNNRAYIIDLGSSNGTYLNGRRLVSHAERLLRNGDQVRLGRLNMKIKF